jgi:hypothetical protein
MKVGVAQSLSGETVEHRRVDVGAETAELREADVVEDDEQHVGRTGRRAARRRPPRGGFIVIATNDSAEGF